MWTRTLVPALLALAAHALPSVPHPQPIDIRPVLVPRDDGHVYYYVNFAAPSGAVFTALNGKMTVPDSLPDDQTYYFWPGLQPADNSGVLQQVLGNENGTAWFWDSVWCCADPSLTWGSGFAPSNSETLSFTNAQSSDASWKTTVGAADDDSLTKGQTWDLPDGHFMTQALFVIELYSPATWNTGPLTFTDITMVTNSSSTDWCTGSPADSGNLASSVSTPSATSDGSSSTCTVDKIVLQSAT